MAQILVFGNSIALGSWDKEGGWVDRLRKYFCKKRIESQEPGFYFFVYNLGVSGNTTKEVLLRFENEVKVRHIDEDPNETVFLLAIGINDAQWMNDEKRTRLSKDEFKNNLEKLMGLARSYSSKIIFLGLVPVDEEKVDPIPWMPELSYKNKYIKKFNNAIMSFCKENQVDFIDIFNKWIKSDYKKWLFDGVHPNTEGHKRIFKKVKDYLTKYTP